MFISNERLEQMSALLAAMGNRNKLSADGLGIYLGDGIPRADMGELRSNELKSIIDELIVQRSKQGFEWALDALLEGLQALNADSPHVAREALRQALWGKLG